MNLPPRAGDRLEADGCPALRFERLLAHSPAAVWAALVEPAALANWMHAEAPVVESGVGGRFHMRLGGGSSLVEGVIRRWEPPCILEYTWLERAARGASVVRFEVIEHGEGSRLILTHIFTAGLAGGGDLADFASGWHWHLDCLAGALEGRARRFDPTGWAALREAYASTL